MKVSINKDRILVQPETAFEAWWLYQKYPQGVTHKAFVKTGLDLNDRLGVVIEPADEKGKT